MVSEWTKPVPSPSVVEWLANVGRERVWLSVVTLAELRRGVELLGPGKRRARLGLWLEDDLSARFEGRVLDIDTAVADAWGRLTAHAELAGKRPPVMDALLAATAYVHGLVMVTRNRFDFEPLGITVFNPWDEF